MEKLDLTKKYKSYFTAKTKPEIVVIEKASYLSITGKGDPSDKAFAQSIEALYPVAYALKFAYKAKNKDFVVSKLEGLWWFDETKYPSKTIATSSIEVPRSEWEYRLLIRLPEFVVERDFHSAVTNALSKKDNPRIHDLELFTMTEGTCVQMLHLGPFSDEPATLAAIGKFIEEKNFKRNGLHHEIYLSDFRKTPPEKLRTILREPVK